MAEETLTDLVDEFLGETHEDAPAAETTAPETAEPEAAEETAPAEATETETAEPAEEEEVEETEEPGEVAEPPTNEQEPDKTPNPPKKQKYSNRYVKRLEHERYEMERRLKTLEAQFARMSAPKPPPPPEKPKRSQFSSEDEYMEAFGAWSYANEQAKHQQAASEQSAANDAAAQFVREWQDKVDRALPIGSEERKDYDERCKSSLYPALGTMVPDTQAFLYVYNSPEAPLVQRYLWDHPKTVSRLAAAPVFEQFDILRKIRSFVGVPETKPSANPRPQPTPIGSARTGKGSPNLAAANASAEDVFDVLAGISK